MKFKVAGCFFLVAWIALGLIVSAGSGQELGRGNGVLASERSKNNLKTPTKLIGAILLPGTPLRFDISWVDQATARYYLGEAGNAGVDVIDAKNDLFLCRITGFHGLGTPDDPCGPRQGMVQAAA